MSLFTREDWTLFRSLNTLGQKAGVPVALLGALVIKELVDNALDAGADVNVDVDDEGWVTITDNGPGIDHEMVPTLFSIRRPLTSSKIVRLPMRGALGNGLRVVMGAIYASQGQIMVETGTQDDQMTRFTLNPRDDGHTDIVTQMRGSHRKGTVISIKLGTALAQNRATLLHLAKMSLVFAPLGKHYHGQTSPWWYDGEAFFEMCQAAGETSMANVLRLFRDIKPGLAVDVADSRGFVKASDLSKAEAEGFLGTLRNLSRAPKPAILGSIGEIGGYYRGTDSGILKNGQSPVAEIPFVIEVFSRPLGEEVDRHSASDEKDQITFMVNRTKITGEIRSYRTKSTKLGMWGCGLGHVFDVPRDMPLAIIVNITIPYMPITTDGKEPDFRSIVGHLTKAIKQSTGKCKRDNRKTVDGAKMSQRDMIVDNLQEAIDKASSDGKYRFSLRNLYYAIRPYLLDHFEKGLDYNYFGSVITQIESDQGHDIVGMYRDPRGKLYHPHTREEIALGTVAVENYERPAWTFNKILYIEKGGFFPLLQDVNWPERNDCALLTSQGFASRAVRDVIDLLGETEEEITVFCIHDADASGTMIYQSLMGATKARGARNINIINLGLDPDEARDMGLQVETFRDDTSRKLPVANYLDSYDTFWLQTQRVELNAMTSEEFLNWLDAKFEPYAGKIVPPKPVLATTYGQQAAEAITKHLTEKILLEGNLTGRHSALFSQVDPDGMDLEIIVTDGLHFKPEVRWDAPLGEAADTEAMTLVTKENNVDEEEASPEA